MFLLPSSFLLYMNVTFRQYAIVRKYSILHEQYIVFVSKKRLSLMFTVYWNKDGHRRLFLTSEKVEVNKSITLALTTDFPRWRHSHYPISYR